MDNWNEGLPVTVLGDGDDDDLVFWSEGFPLAGESFGLLGTTPFNALLISPG